MATGGQPTGNSWPPLLPVCLHREESALTALRNRAPQSAGELMCVMWTGGSDGIQTNGNPRNSSSVSHKGSGGKQSVKKSHRLDAQNYAAQTPCWLVGGVGRGLLPALIKSRLRLKQTGHSQRCSRCQAGGVWEQKFNFLLTTTSCALLQNNSNTEKMYCFHLSCKKQKRTGCPAPPHTDQSPLPLLLA